MRLGTLLFVVGLAAGCAEPSLLTSVPCSDFEISKLEKLFAVEELLPLEDRPPNPSTLFACDTRSASAGVSITILGYPVSAIDDLTGGFDALPEEQVDQLLRDWGLPLDAAFDESADRISIPEFQFAVMRHRGLVSGEPLVATDTELAYVDASDTLFLTRQHGTTVLMLGIQGMSGDPSQDLDELRMVGDYVVTISSVESDG